MGREDGGGFTQACHLRALGPGKSSAFSTRFRQNLAPLPQSCSWNWSSEQAGGPLSLHSQRRSQMWASCLPTEGFSGPQGAVLDPEVRQEGWEPLPDKARESTLQLQSGGDPLPTHPPKLLAIKKI